MRPATTLLASILSLSFVASAKDAPPPPANVIAQTNVMVAMRDGVELATDIYLPAKDEQPIAEKLPVILTRTPYNKNGSKKQGEYFAQQAETIQRSRRRRIYGSQHTFH